MYSQIAQNKRNTWMVLFVFILFLLLVGYGWGYAFSLDHQASLSTMQWVGVFAVLYASFSYYMAGKMTLSMAGASPIEKRDYPELYRVVENLSITAGIPTPKIYIIDTKALNAFATGRDPKHAYVAVTQGLLDELEKAELEGVMAHEISHITNYDIRLQSIVVALVGVIVFVSDVFLRSLRHGSFRSRGGKNSGGGAVITILIGLILAILSPIFAKLMHLAISRQREYLADASGAFLTRHPEGLARALEKLKADTRTMKAASGATAHLYIDDPLQRENTFKWLNNLFATHPDIDDRIARLHQIGQ